MRKFARKSTTLLYNWLKILDFFRAWFLRKPFFRVTAISSNHPKTQTSLMSLSKQILNNFRSSCTEIESKCLNRAQFLRNLFSNLPAVTLKVLLTTQFETGAKNPKIPLWF